MHSEITDREQRRWWARQRHDRAQSALKRMLEFQEDKARKFVKDVHDPRHLMLGHSLKVRGMLEKVRRIETDARVLEVGSGAHGLIFFFGAERGIGVDPLAHHYVSLFPAWQRRVPTVSAYGEALPFPNNSFEVLLSDDVLDYAEDPAAIMAEMARVLIPSGTLYITLNISHPVWKGWSALHRVADFHTTHISLKGARRLFRHLPLHVVWESHNIAETRAATGTRQERRFRAWVKSVFYYRARFEAIAVGEANPYKQNPER